MPVKSLLSVAMVLLGGVAQASSLSLSCELLSSGASPCPSTPPSYAVPGQYGYSQTFIAPTGSTTIAGSSINGNSAGFIDDYQFDITTANADVVTATISLGGEFSISDLFARIYSLPSNPGGLVTTNPVGAVYNGTVTTSGAATEVVINPVMLADGAYVLEISGLTSGSLGGMYEGSLNLTQVPLPASLPMLLAALVGLGFMLRRAGSTLSVTRLSERP
ncbi:MAG: hypothetical protein WCA14_04645 [Steroidobacteraceae bacterium]